MSEQEVGLIPYNLQLPETVGGVFEFRLALGEAMNTLMRLKTLADDVIEDQMAGRTEAVIDGVPYSYDGPKSWAYEDVPLLNLLNEMEADGSITKADYDEAVKLVPQPDKVTFNPTKLRHLVEKRGLVAIDECRTHKVGSKRLKRLA